MGTAHARRSQPPIFCCFNPFHTESTLLPYILEESIFSLKVGSWGFEGTIILIILFSKLLESTFYKEISKFQQKSIELKILN